MISINLAQKSDWDQFYLLATAEGWRVPKIERLLFAGSWSDFAWALNIDGRFGGFVTAVPHERSGWIGNLLVPQSLRGQGYGVQLFRAALDSLSGQGLSTCWLTASESGLPIYQKAGFVSVDQVERWVSPERQGSETGVETKTDPTEKLWLSDQGAWEEERSSLLEALASHGQTFACEDSVAFLQRDIDVQIIGPWYSPSCFPRANRQLLQRILSAADPDGEIVVDIRASSPIRQLIAAAGFDRAGSTSLMRKGAPAPDGLSTMVSLASLGSFG